MHNVCNFCLQKTRNHQKRPEALTIRRDITIRCIILSKSLSYHSLHTLQIRSEMYDLHNDGLWRLKPEPSTVIQPKLTYVPSLNFTCYIYIYITPLHDCTFLQFATRPISCVRISLWKLILRQVVKKLPIVTGSGSPLPSSQDHGTEFYPDPDEFSLHPHILLF
jgi:hypothetical protein